MLVYVSPFSLIIAPEYGQTVEPLPKSYWYKPGCFLIPEKHFIIEIHFTTSPLMPLTKRLFVAHQLKTEQVHVLVA